MSGDYTTEFEKENDDLLEDTFMTIYVKDDQRKDNQFKMRWKDGSSCHIRRS